MIHKLCQNGRVFIPDASTGHHVCLCYLETYPAHSFQAHPAFRGIRTLASSHSHINYLNVYHKQLSAVTTLLDHTSRLLPRHLTLSPYGSMYVGVDDIEGPTRKAVTHDTTGPLKDWLSDHGTNPYPTKAEKIMLATTARMTLTQVSTWFANARRRLKKDKRVPPGVGEDNSVRLGRDIDGNVEIMSTDVAVSEIRIGQLSSEKEGEPLSDASNEDNDIIRLNPNDQFKKASRVRVQVSMSSSSMRQSDFQVCLPPSNTSQSDFEVSMSPSNIKQSEVQLPTSLFYISQSNVHLCRSLSTISQSDHHLSRSLSNISQSDLHLSRSLSNISQSDLHLSRSLSNISQSDLHLSRSLSNISQSEDPVSKYSSHMNKSENQVVASSSDISQSESHLAVSPTNMNQSETFSSNSCQSKMSGKLTGYSIQTAPKLKPKIWSI